MKIAVFPATILCAILMAPGCKTLEDASEVSSPTLTATSVGEHTVSSARAAFAQRTGIYAANPLTARTTLLNEGTPVMVTGFSGNLAEVSLPDGRRGFVDRALLKKVEPEIAPEDVLVPVLGDDFVQPGFPVSRPGPPPVPVPRSLIEEANDLEMPSIDP